MLRFGRQLLGDLDAGARREWLVADGLGGYAMGTVPGLRTRRYHGLLVVAVGAGGSARMLGLAALDPTLVGPDLDGRPGRRPAGDAAGRQGGRGQAIAAGGQASRRGAGRGAAEAAWAAGMRVVDRSCTILNDYDAPAVAARVATVRPDHLLDVSHIDDGIAVWREIVRQRIQLEAAADAVRAAAVRVDVPAGAEIDGGGMRFADPSGPDAGQDLRAAAVVGQWLSAGDMAVVYPPAYATARPHLPA